ncbi:MAG: formate dehydrogenase accessory sulfurtransferase FdhD [Calditrichaeota bacterium]|nr:MAG: formate dehydrogenase accessory sulfurtransferase FdhD [Calditrichota bacterium]
MQTGLFKARRFNATSSNDVNDTLTIEAPLQININSRPFTITMRTPGDDLHLVRGLLFTENIYIRASGYNFQERKARHSEFTYSVNFISDSESIPTDLENRRSILSVSSCGICGKKDLADLMQTAPPLKEDFQINSTLLLAMFEKMNREQNTFNRSGGSHAAAAFDDLGKMLSIKEDIGRHNAVDKVIGMLLCDGKLRAAKVLLVSGRVSFEIVTKAFMAKIPVLAAVSAPSSLAVETAGEMGITLAAFCRKNRITAYSHISRIIEGKNACQTI